jgi:hypothetical protein
MVPRPDGGERSARARPRAHRLTVGPAETAAACARAHRSSARADQRGSAPIARTPASRPRCPVQSLGPVPVAEGPAVRSTDRLPRPSPVWSPMLRRSAPEAPTRESQAAGARSATSLWASGVCRPANASQAGEWRGTSARCLAAEGSVVVAPVAGAPSGSGLCGQDITPDALSPAVLPDENDRETGDHAPRQPRGLSPVPATAARRGGTGRGGGWPGWGGEHAHISPTSCCLTATS